MQEQKEEGMSDTTKIAIGVGIAAVAALAVYALTRKPGTVDKAVQDAAEAAKKAAQEAADAAKKSAQEVAASTRSAQEAADAAKKSAQEAAASTRSAQKAAEGAKDALGKGGSSTESAAGKAVTDAASGVAGKGAGAASAADNGIAGRTANPVEEIVRRAEKSAENAELSISGMASDTASTADKGIAGRTPKSERNAAKVAMKKAAKKAAKKAGKPFLPEGVAEVKKQYGDTEVYLTDGRRILISPIEKEKNIRYYDKNGNETLWLKKKPGRRGIKKVTGNNPNGWPTIYEGQEVGKGVYYNSQLDKVFPVSKHWVGKNGNAFYRGIADYCATVHI